MQFTISQRTNSQEFNSFEMLVLLLRSLVKLLLINGPKEFNEIKRVFYISTSSEVILVFTLKEAIEICLTLLDFNFANLNLKHEIVNLINIFYFVLELKKKENEFPFAHNIWQTFYGLIPNKI
ncbi:hypothetical protein HK099_003884 [Clydaea vesicula]|uniref:Uncharacterized protein n=1 Tax=Clydaea vesicula TaxID=447962 RepID=A0AAD5U306_9FUNG|nr:hypothetical protein HK099_003884 [Clydaea vesicula]